jgi:hypothetical protein
MKSSFPKCKKIRFKKIISQVVFAPGSQTCATELKEYGIGTCIPPAFVTTI